MNWNLLRVKDYFLNSSFNLHKLKFKKKKVKSNSINLKIDCNEILP